MAQILARVLFLIFCISISGNGAQSRQVTSNDEGLKVERSPIGTSKTQSIVYAGDSIKVASHVPLSSQVEGSKRKGFQLERFVSLETLMRNGSGPNNQPSDDKEEIINHWAALQQEKGEYYGAMGTLNVYGLPEVGIGQGSAALIWVVNDYGSSIDDFNEIRAGWHVYPAMHGDSETHFFISWTADGREITGCYNMDCEGFVLNTSTKHTPGGIIRPLSSYNGEQYFITIKISKDQQTGDWWLHAGQNGEDPVGYWPKSLFTSLADSASIIQWGGVVAFHKDQTGPPMGSGHFPDEGEGRAASMLGIKLVSMNGELYDPKYFEFADKRDFYLVNGENPAFGGPGGCTD